MTVKQIAKEIFNGSRYFILYSGGKAIARYQILSIDGFWTKDFAEKNFDNKEQAAKYLKEKILEQAQIIAQQEAQQ